MNRKTFLASLIAIVTAPFTLKSKEKETIKLGTTEDVDRILAPYRDLTPAPDLFNSGNCEYWIDKPSFAKIRLHPKKK